MNSLRVLASPRVWGPILGIVVVLALIFYAYLAAVTSRACRGRDDLLPRPRRRRSSGGKRPTEAYGPRTRACGR
jgi:hypothetical protein